MVLGGPCVVLGVEPVLYQLSGLCISLSRVTTNPRIVLEDTHYAYLVKPGSLGFSTVRWMG